MEKEKISVIVPVFNLEDRLERCLNSITNQSYTNLEILVIDDGSTDKSSVMCDKFAQEDGRIVVVHKANGGISSARNLALDMATGDYIAFVDSDDYIEADMLLNLYSVINKYEADIVIEYFYVVKNGIKIPPKTRKNYSIEVYDEDKVSLFYNFFNDKRGITTVVWNKLYKRSIFTNIRFPLNKIYEDKYVMHHFLEKAHKVVYTRECNYNYCINDNGLTNMPFTISKLDDYYAEKERYVFLLFYKDSKLTNLATKRLMSYAIFYFCLLYNNFPNEIELLTSLKRDYNSLYNNSKIRTYKYVFFRYLPTLYYRAQHINELITLISKKRT